jgi:hypothetical protein
MHLPPTLAHKHVFVASQSANFDCVKSDRSDGHADGIGHVEVIWTANLGRAFDFVREQDAAAASTGSVNSGSFVGPGLK